MQPFHMHLIYVTEKCEGNKSVLKATLGNKYVRSSVTLGF